MQLQSLTPTFKSTGLRASAISVASSPSHGLPADSFALQTPHFAAKDAGQIIQPNIDAILEIKDNIAGNFSTFKTQIAAIIDAANNARRYDDLETIFNLIYKTIRLIPNDQANTGSIRTTLFTGQDEESPAGELLHLYCSFTNVEQAKDFFIDGTSSPEFIKRKNKVIISQCKSLGTVISGKGILPLLKTTISNILNRFVEETRLLHNLPKED